VKFDAMVFPEFSISEDSKLNGMPLLQYLRNLLLLEDWRKIEFGLRQSTKNQNFVGSDIAAMPVNSISLKAVCERRAGHRLRRRVKAWAKRFRR